VRIRPPILPALLLLGALAFAHSERYLDPVPIPPGGPGAEPAPPDGAAPDAPGPITPVERTAHWRIWWRLNRERLLDLDALVERRTRESISGGGAPPANEERGRAALLPSLRTAARDPDGVVASSALVSLGRVRDEPSRPLFLSIVAEGAEEPSVEEAAALAAGLTGGEVRGALAALVGDGERTAGARAFAALGLGFLGDPGALPLLLGVGKDRPRAEMLIGAGLLGEPMAVPDLAEIAASGADPLVRVAALAALAKLADPRGVGGAAAALRDPSVHVRRQAALTLGAVAAGNGKAIALVRTALEQDPDPVVRSHAAVALGEIGTEADLDLLRSLYRTGEPGLAPYAATGAALLCRRFPEASDTTAALRLFRFQLSEGLGPELESALCAVAALTGDAEAIPMLRRVLEDGSAPAAKGEAAVALGVVGASGAAPEIRKVLEEARDPGLILQASLGLGLVRRAEAETALLAVLSGEGSASARAAAALALGRLAGARGATLLEEILGDAGQPAPVRAAAATALGWHLSREEGPRLARIGDRTSHHLLTPALATALNLR
jgi:HEAT repeat protein